MRTASPWPPRLMLRQRLVHRTTHGLREKAAEPLLQYKPSAWPGCPLNHPARHPLLCGGEYRLIEYGLLFRWRTDMRREETPEGMACMACITAETLCLVTSSLHSYIYPFPLCTPIPLSQVKKEFLTLQSHSFPLHTRLLLNLI